MELALAPTMAVIGGAIGSVDCVPYIADIVRGRTRPHRGTWAIWLVLSWVALASNAADGAGWSLIPLTAQALQNCVIFALSLRRGEGGVSRADRVMLAIAGLGVVGWLVASNPTIATVAVIVADVMGAAMMLPKSWSDPWSETPATFVLSAVVGAATMLAVGRWSLELLLYPAYYVVVNGALAAVLLARRRRVHGGSSQATPSLSPSRPDR